MNFVRNLTWTPPLFSHQHLAFLRGLQVPYHLLECGMLTYLGGCEGRPESCQPFTPCVFPRFTDIVPADMTAASSRSAAPTTRRFRDVLAAVDGVGLAGVKRLRTAAGVSRYLGAYIITHQSQRVLTN